MREKAITAEKYLERAAELRAVAGQIADAHNRRMLIDAAESYEQMAGRLAGAVEAPQQHAS